MLVTHGDSNDLRETDNLNSLGLDLASCAVVVRRWSKESLAAESGVVHLALEKEQDDDQVSRFQFKEKSPLNFAVVNYNKAFVLDFSESENRWAAIPTLIGTPSLNQRTKKGMTSAGFVCVTKGGVHDVICLNSSGAVIGHVLAVPKFAEEYQVVSNGEVIELEFGKVDVSVWLGQRWHPMRYSGAICQDDLKLHFRYRVDSETP